MKYLYLCMAILAAAGCTPKEKKDGSVLAAPSGVVFTADSGDPASGALAWQDNCNSESGYYVFILESGAVPSKPAASLPANSTSYTVSGLTEGSSYRFAVQTFGKDYSLSQLAYASEIYTVPKPEEPAEPEPAPLEETALTPLTFSWTEVTGLSLPSSVKIYKTTDNLNGRAFNAWYAIAGTDDVDFRVLFNQKKATIDKQAADAGDCLVLINGGIFGSGPNGFALCDGVQTPWFRVEADGWDVDRQYWGPDPNGSDVPPAADGKLHTVSRALFGVDADGVPGVFWSYTPKHGTVYVYNLPIPSVEGEAVLPGATDTYPCKRSSWAPYNAITCGPVLLQRGACPISARKTDKGYWATNYEMWASDIFGVDQLHDRTSVGYTADGKIILFVCDGRISASQGATTLEIAAVMKGLGCVGAINLDGGGSTGMWAAGQHLNDLTGGNRAVMTTLGFFTKK